MDRVRLQEYLEHVVSKYTAAELVELLEDEGLITTWDVISFFEEQVIEIREKIEA